MVNVRCGQVVLVMVDTEERCAGEGSGVRPKAGLPAGPTGRSVWGLDFYYKCHYSFDVDSLK